VLGDWLDRDGVLETCFAEEVLEKTLSKLPLPQTMSIRLLPLSKLPPPQTMSIRLLPLTAIHLQHCTSASIFVSFEVAGF
jgi:hypothetical protein